MVGTTNEPATVTVAGQPAPSDGTNTFRGSAPTAAGTTTVSVTATDPNGNAATRQYEVDVAGATTTYTFDDNGNLTGDGLKTYVWNARNQLLKVQQGGADVAVFTYDGAGRRVTKTAGGVTRTYIYDGPDILEERVSTGDVIRYVHGPGMDNVLARTTNGANAVYYATDHLGSIVHETNAVGAVTLHREYDAWGELKQGQGTSGFAFTGREWDAETGLYFYRARYYEPTSGRFVGQDPAGYVDGPNLFAYVGGRPTGATDPTGRAVWVLPWLAPAGGAIITAGEAAAAAGIGALVGWVASKITDIVGRPPFDGPPGETVRGDKQTRRYGPDGLPETDVDAGHHEKIYGKDGHSHDWSRPADGSRPTDDNRSDHRPWKTGDPPKPNSCK